MKREEIFQYVKEQYGTEPEYLWKKDPDSAVLRHKNGKWYAIIMAVEKKTLGLEEDGKINILDVKCDPDLVGMLIQTYGFLQRSEEHTLNSSHIEESRMPSSA